MFFSCQNYSCSLIGSPLRWVNKLIIRRKVSLVNTFLKMKLFDFLEQQLDWWINRTLMAKISQYGVRSWPKMFKNKLPKRVWNYQLLIRWVEFFDGNFSVQAARRWRIQTCVLGFSIIRYNPSEIYLKNLDIIFGRLMAEQRFEKDHCVAHVFFFQRSPARPLNKVWILMRILE